jgi:flagellar protein FliS
MPAASATNPFLADTVLTAPRERLLVMLYDRLALDLVRGEAAIDRDDAYESHVQLTHAQAIIAELRSSFDVTVWPEGRGLLSIYDYITKLLVDANVRKDRTLVAEARSLVAPLHDAWRTAAEACAA